MENIVVAASNLYALRAMYVAFYDKKNFLQGSVLLGAMLSSTVYHLFECKKHRMPGFSVLRSNLAYHITINIDRFFALFSIWVLFDYDVVLEHWPIVVAGLLAMTVSETVFRQEKNMYMVLHILWHLLAFHVAYILVLEKKS